MTNDREQPCLRRIDADCFRSNPAWAKRAFAYRLVHLLTPKPLTKRLPEALRTALLAPGVEIPSGVILPDGMVVSPGAVIPPGWTPGDPVPSGITIAPGTVFPPGWTPGDPIPEGVTLEPGATFPPGWTPGDPLPPGAIVPATTPPGVDATGATPPTYLEVWSPGPPRFLSKVSVVGALYTITPDSTDGRVANVGYGWTTVRNAATGTVAHWTGAYSNEATQARMRSATGFTIGRSFLTFDLSTLPSKTPKSVQLVLHEYQYHASSVVIQKHLHDGVAHTHDYDSFEDPEFGHVAWADGDNTITFNPDGLDYIAGVLGSSAKLCCREYEHDFLNDPPTGYQNFRNGFYYSEEITAERVPRLLIQL